MKVTLIGTGNMGSALAKHLVTARHALTITGRDAVNIVLIAPSTGQRHCDRPTTLGMLRA